jgi:predicted MFS family arabinose efflux permease
VPAGIAIGIPALARITPPGTFRARPGLPAAAIAAFLLSVGFASAEAFVPLMLTGVAGLSVGEAGILVTLVTICWSLGSWWQSRQMGRRGPVPLVIAGAVMLAVGIAGGATALVSAPIWIPYVAWSIAGVGMGIAFPTIPLAVMGVATAGREAGELSSTLLMDNLGIGIGAGLGGACVAIAKHADAGLEPGIAGAFAIGLVATLALVVVAGRLPGGTALEDAG